MDCQQGRQWSRIILPNAAKLVVRWVTVIALTCAWVVGLFVWRAVAVSAQEVRQTNVTHDVDVSRSNSWPDALVAGLLVAVVVIGVGAWMSWLKGRQS